MGPTVYKLSKQVVASKRVSVQKLTHAAFSLRKQDVMDMPQRQQRHKTEKDEVRVAYAA